jgi:hypothetical protein
MVHRWLAAGAGTVAVLEVVAAAVLSAAVGWSLTDVLDSFVATNSAMGVTFAVCGAIIAWHRPRNAIGWLFAGAGLAHATSALGAPLLKALHDGSAPVGVQRAVITAFSYSWPWSISLFLPLALLLFPDGRAPSPRWRPVVVATIATAPLFVLEMGTSQEPLDQSIPFFGYLTVAGQAELQPLWVISELRVTILLALAIIALVLRYRRTDETGRRQLLWLVLATIALLTGVVPWSFVAGTPAVVLFAIPLVPIAITIAIVRHQLLDIRLFFSRAVLYLLLISGVAVTYVMLVALLGLMLRRQVGLGASVLVTVVIAVGFNTVRARLQRLLDRVTHGSMTPADTAFRNPVRPTLERFGLPAEMIEEAERYNLRYQLRELGTLLIFGVAINSLIAAGLLVLSFTYLDDEQVWLLVLSTLVSSLLAVIVTSTLLRALIRRNMLTYTVHLLFQVIADLSRTQRLKRPNGQIRHRRRIAGLLRATRQNLQIDSWILTGNLTILSGRRLDERDRPPAALLGRWLCWAGESIDNTDRVEDALQACVDTLRHVVHPESLGLPPLRHPPDQARILRPPRTDWRRYGNGAQAALISSIPLITTSIGLVTKLTP